MLFGFTLIELIVVIAIIAILAAVLIPRFSGFTDKARTTQAIVAAKQVATAADALYVEKNAAPTAAEIQKVAGADIITGQIGDIAVAGEHITFTYYVLNGTKYYAAARYSDGSFYTGDGTTGALAVTAAKAALAAAHP